MLQIKILNILTVARMTRVARMARPLARMARRFITLRMKIRVRETKVNSKDDIQ